MEVIINNQPREIPEETTVYALLKRMEMDHAKGMAVAVNKKVVPKNQWEATRLNSRDEVLLIRASQGG